MKNALAARKYLTRLTAWRFAALVLSLLLCTAVSFAQTPAPTPATDLLETSWHVAINGGYSNLSNQATNNGYITSVAVRVAKHWNARFDYFATATPKAAIFVVGPEYNFSLAHILPASSYLDVSKLEAFVNVRAGAGRSDPQGSPFKFAIATGGGINYHVSDTLTLRPIEVSLVHNSSIGTQIIGNHLQFASGIGLRF